MFVVAVVGGLIGAVLIHRLEQFRAVQALRPHTHLLHIRRAEFVAAFSLRELRIDEGRRGDVGRIRDEGDLVLEVGLQGQVVPGGERLRHRDLVLLVRLERTAEAQCSAGHFGLQAGQRAFVLVHHCGEFLADRHAAHGDEGHDLLHEGLDHLVRHLGVGGRQEALVKIDLDVVVAVEGCVRLDAANFEGPDLADLDVIARGEGVVAGGVGQFF